MKRDIFTKGAVALALLLAFTFSVKAQTLSRADSANDYRINFSYTQDYTHNSRRLNSVSLNGVSISLPTPLKVYSLVDNPTFEATRGETVTATFGFTTSWMNGFVYIDRGQDGVFDAVLEDNGAIPAGSDIMAFSYAEPALNGTGYNSNGDVVTNPDVLNPPAFKIPSDLPNGFYRMRYKVDWASIDPAGRTEDGNGIIKNGGAICDVRLNVHGQEVNVQGSAKNGTVTMLDGTAVENIQHTFGEPLTVKATPDKGYRCDVITIRHGHNLNGNRAIHGVAQYQDEIIPAIFMNGDTFEIPADYIDGDVVFEVSFVKVAGDIVDGKDYVLSFDKNMSLSGAAPLSGVEFTVSRGRNATLSLDNNITTAYSDQMAFELPVRPGAYVTAKVVSPNSKLKYYIYVDINNDGMFVPLVDDEGKSALSSELLSFGAADAGNLPVFVVPEILPYGIYRARIKADVDNYDPAGSAKIVEEGGMVVDFLLNVYNDKCNLKLDSYNGALYAPGDIALPMTVEAYKGFRVEAVPVDDGYIMEEFGIRYGYNLDGPQYVNGNRQWNEKKFTDEIVFLSNDNVWGDIVIYANFVAGPDAEYRLVFSDEFNSEDGTQPNSKWWSRCKREGATWNRWLSDSEEVIYIEDGNLVARAIPNPDTSKDNVPMITGGIWTRGKFGFTYGRVEGRIKANPWTGNFPAFWMMPEDQSGGWPNDGEIDIWETIDSQERSWHTVHSHWTYDLKNTANPQSSFNVSTSLDRYHIYAIEWDENSITWFVDGKQVGIYGKSSSDDALSKGQWPFNDDFHLILNQSVGNGSWAANADVNHTYVTLFDWVRVYQKEGMHNTSIDNVVEVCEDNLCVTPIEGGVSLSSPKSVNVSVFDAVGRKVGAFAVSGTKSILLDQGLYIIDGKKVYVD